MIDFKLCRFSGFECPLCKSSMVDDQVAKPLLRVLHPEQRSGRRPDHAAIADLSSRLAVKRRLVQHDQSALSLGQRVDELSLRDDGADLAFRRLGVITEKIRAPGAFLDIEPDRLRAVSPDPAQAFRASSRCRSMFLGNGRGRLRCPWV